MNCKPGDLAIVIKADAQHIDCIGTIVKVMGPSLDFVGQWIIEWPGKKPDSCKRDVQSSPDNNLYPVSGLPLQEGTDISTYLHTSHTTGTTTKAPA